MVMALFILMYYLYVVCDFASQMYFYMDSTSYEENIISSTIADPDQGFSEETRAQEGEILPTYLYQTPEEVDGEKSRPALSKHTPKISVLSSTSKLKSSNKGRKSVHVIEIVEREPEMPLAQSEELQGIRPARVSTVSDVTSSALRGENLEDFQSSGKPVRPYSHQSQRKNVSFVDETKSASSIENT